MIELDKLDIVKIIKNIIFMYLIYVIITGVLIFLIKPKDIKTDIKTEKFYGEEISNDRAMLVEDRYQSYLVRMDLIENAEETLDIAYYTIHDGRTTRAFLGSILEKADEGVQVRFLIDGMFHNMKKDLKDVIYAFENHPNIELKFYETVKPLQPWTLNNRLHDKVIIVDGNLFISGGRNIGDKYFLEDYPEDRQVRDRDVLVYREEKSKESSVDNFIDYFEKLWDIEYSVNPAGNMNSRKIEKGNRMKEILLTALEEERAINKDLEKDIDYEKNSFPTNKVSLVHNPVHRLNKYPLVFETIVKLTSDSKNIDVQSPYVLPTWLMKSYSKNYDIDYEDITLLTNSEYSSPNIFAMSGYVRDRKKIIDTGLTLFEYQEPGSIHGKSYIFDDRLSVIGSLNMDNRSAFLSTETMIFVDSEEFSEHLLKEFDRIEGQSLKVGRDYEYIDKSEDIKEASFFKKVIIRLFSLVTYLFDYML